MTATPNPPPTSGDQFTPLPGAGAPAADPPAPVSLWPYLGGFVAAVVGFSLVLTLVEELLDTSLSGVNMLVPFFGAMVVIDQFVKKHDRVPDSRESWWLIWWSFGISVGWAVLVLVIFAAAGWLDGVGDLLGIWWPILLLLGAALTFLMIWLGFRIWPKRSLANRRKYLERQAAKAAKRSAR